LISMTFQTIQATVNQD